MLKQQQKKKGRWEDCRMIHSITIASSSFPQGLPDVLIKFIKFRWTIRLAWPLFRSHGTTAVDYYASWAGQAVKPSRTTPRNVDVSVHPGAAWAHPHAHQAGPGRQFCPADGCSCSLARLHTA